MSTTMLPQSVRQPFGAVSQARLRNLTNTKNTQNSLPPANDKGSKEAPAFQFSDFDSENVDPASLISALKDNKTASASTKAPLFKMNTVNHRQPLDKSLSLSASRKRKVDATELSSTQGPQLKRKLDSDLAPIVPLGRSPPRKHAGLLSRRRAGSTYKRIDPPGSPSSIPFSLGAALAGTIPQKPKKRVTKKRWEFQIYEDSPQEEMANLMEHSTCTLDISDDENRVSDKGDRDNKENVPPSEYQTRTASHQSQDMMTEKVRTPLGDLEAKEFYAEGCDATSAFIIPADDETSAAPMPKIEEESPISPCPKVDSVGCPQLEGVSAVAVPDLEPGTSSSAGLHEEKEQEDNSLDFEIWESGSAKDESEAVTDTVAIEGI